MAHFFYICTFIAMEQLTGKTLVFTDHHFGVKGNSPSRQKIGAMAIKDILDAISAYSIKNIIFCGDYFHQRNALTVDTLNIAYRCLQALAKKCNVYMVLGNHDLFNKNSTDINSINIFRDNASIIVVDSPTEVSMNGKHALLVPWLSDLSRYSNGQFDFMFGHFDISSKFLIANYAQEHSRKVRTTGIASKEIDNDGLLDSSRSISCSPEQYLGSFIDLVHENGTIFAGHIHQHKEMTVHKRKFIFVGTPYEQNLGDIGCKCGFYVIDEDGSYKFVENANLPKHVQFICSKVKEAGIDNYDFSLAKENIVQKVYDIDISMEDDLKINQKIASFKPYEELLPDYQVALDFAKEDISSAQGNLVNMLKKSKLDYVKSYIEQLDNAALEADGIDKAKLFSIMNKYYLAAIGDDEQ